LDQFSGENQKEERIVSPLIQLKTIVALLIALTAVALAPASTAVNPPPDGGYPGQNTAEGDDAAFSLTTGIDNTAMGFHALYNNTTGGRNTAYGSSALLSNSTGVDNTAIGFHALYSQTTTFDPNTAVGSNALFSNTMGGRNTATGVEALYSNTSGVYNTANGHGALYGNTIGDANTATGVQTLFHNSSGRWNTATGFEALLFNTTGSYNTGTGMQALQSNSTGNYNTGMGFRTLLFNTTGSYNTATGNEALVNNNIGSDNTANGAGTLVWNRIGTGNTACGRRALRLNTRGSNNIALGIDAGSNLTTGDNNIDIGALGVAGESNIIRIGRQGTQNGTFIAGISAVAVTGSQVVVNANGKLSVAASSVRFKDDIKPMDNASEAILALKPVTFRYKKEIDADRIPQFGLVAEEVAKVNPDLVTRDADGKVFAVRYEAVNAMLLNEFLKEHRKVEQMQKQIDALTAGLQKVNAQLELSKSAPQTVLNNQ
jgi:hypothetical protein